MTAWLAVVGLVVAVHACVAERWVAHLNALAASSADEPSPQRLKAVYVRSMALTEPVALAAAAPVARRSRAIVSRAVAAQAASQASAPSVVASAPESAPSAATEPADDPVARGDDPLPTAEAASAVPEGAMVASAASAPAVPAFEWPLATRVTYLLTGYFRGDLAGTAQVEWLRDGPRYQVHLDITVGLPIAPFMSRRMSSEGLITEAGLRPERYDQETRLPFSKPTRAVVRLQDDHVELANGQRRERWADLQDTASQFVHLAWQFSTQPSLLKPGAIITVPLAMPRSMQRMQYDVAEPEMLWTEFGEVPVIRLQPRYVPRPGGDLSVEMWLAPGYRYLPIRLKIHQDPETWVDLRITKPPELGGP